MHDQAQSLREIVKSAAAAESAPAAPDKQSAPALAAAQAVVPAPEVIPAPVYAPTTTDSPVYSPVSDSAAKPVAEAAAAPPQTITNPLAKIITITSGKGGVGKSIITVNLALALRQLGLKILIIDADFGLANIDVMLGMPARYNLSHLLKKEHTLPEIIQQWHEGIYFISGGNGISELIYMNEDQLAEILENIMAFPEPLDVILCDTGAGVNDIILRLAAASTEIVLVTTPEPTAILDAYALLKTINQGENMPNIRLVMNKAVSAKEADNATESFIRITRKYLNKQIEPLGSILYDSDMAKSIKMQTPLLLSQPRSLSARNIMGIAEILLGLPTEKKGSGALSKLFSRWLNQT